ncbi:hypothetical protein BDV93DRAFT_513821 [Ceratobasidium sp. AG-I]|nr:hypothetical protein BDV93DRAFT_513821 [Ceratobasidium sp. AG-I]
MAPQSNPSHINPPSSSPAPIRDTQPQPHSPTTTARGTERYHALFDTPPEDTQPPELKRANRSRVKSARARDTLEYQTRSIPPAAKSNVAASQPNPSSTSHSRVTGPPTSAPRRPKLRKRPSLRFDGEAPSDEDENPRPRKTRNTGTSEQSPPPKPPGRSAPVAPGGLPGRRQRVASPVGQQSITLAPSVARELEHIIGLKLSTSTAQSVREQAQALSNPNPIPLGSSERYTQVQRQPPSSVPILKNKGTSQRDWLLALASPDALQSQMQGPGQPVDTSKPTSMDCTTPPFRSPPPLPAFYCPHTPPPVSSTQRAIVNGGDSQTLFTAARPHAPYISDYRPSPVPQPRSQFPFSQSTFEPANNPFRRSQRESYSPQIQSPHAACSTVVPDRHIPSLAPNSPSPEPQGSRLECSPPTPRSIVLSPEPDPNSVTVSETESEPTLKPKPGHKRCRRSKPCVQADMRDNGSNHGADNNPSPPHDAHVPGAGHAPLSTHPDNRTIFQRLNELLGGNGNDADINMDTLLALVNDVRREQHSCAAHPSTSRAAPNFPVSYNHSGSFSSHTRPAGSASHGHAGLASRRGTRHHPEPCSNSNEAPDSGDDSSNDSSNDEYDPILPDKTGLGRYPGVRGKVASRAIPKMMSTATRKGVYQDHNTAVKWARNAYCRAWKESYSHVSYRQCPKDLLQTIITRVSNLRTLVKDRIRKIVRFVYGFEPSTSDEATMSANRLLAARLGHNTFHCCDTVPEKNQYEHRALTLAIYEAFFWSPDSFFIPDCPALKERDEGLPLVAIAFVLTMMQECIEEWATGRFLSRDLNLTTQRGRFDSHLWGLLNYRSKAGSRLLRFQRRWLNGGLEHAGVRVNQEEPEPYHCQSVTRPENVRPDTPPALGSESEPEEDQHLNTRAKGKGRANHFLIDGSS